MSARSMIRLVILPLAIACTAPVFAAEAPTAHQIYLAAQAGKFEEAQAMMDKVLAAHPNSGKAHFIQAELLAKQGRMIEADAELAKAERFSPGMAFAKPEAVKKLKAMIARANAATPASAPALSSPAPATAANPFNDRPAPAPAPREASAPSSPSLPWGTILIVAAIIALVVGAIRAMRRKATMQPYSAAGAGGGYGPNVPGQPYQPYGGQPGTMMGNPGGGLGSNIMGGLATGAAVGAGIVAGEALMHRFTDSNRDHDSGSSSNHTNFDTPAAAPDPAPLDDMGGTDFGVSDGGSWDDGGGGGGGGDEWN